MGVQLPHPCSRRRLAEARGVVELVARDRGAASLAEVGRQFGRDPSSIGRAVRRVEERAAGETGVQANLRKLKTALMHV